MNDLFDLERFVAAQDAGDALESARRELRAGRKTGHWIWFVFPQIAGLGVSATSRRYAISGLDEARAYLAHPLLGPRLHDALADLGDDPVRVMGPLDATKLRSCLTLFARAAPEDPTFAAALTRFYGSEEDLATLARLEDAHQNRSL